MECGKVPDCHSTYPASATMRRVAYGRFVHQILLAVNAPDTTPPGIFLRLFIFGGLAFVILVGWFVLRGYRDTGSQSQTDDKNK